MHFSSSINRPPYESMCGFLQVTSGCSHSQCEFCTFYKDAPFRVSPIDEIREDIEELASGGWFYKRIYLQGADPFILPYDRLMQISEMIHQRMPYVESIGGYARVDNVENKTVEQLKSLKEAGYNNFYFGNESGDDALLDRMHKGYHADLVVSMLRRLDEAGMDYVMNFLGGLGGHGYGLSHARKSAEVINQLHPTMVYASELTIFPDTPLNRDVEAGTFVEADEAERYEELQELIRNIQIETVFKAEHVTIPRPIRGTLPKDKDRMLHHLEKLITASKNGSFYEYRKRLQYL